VSWEPRSFVGFAAIAAVVSSAWGGSFAAMVAKKFVQSSNPSVRCSAATSRNMYVTYRTVPYHAVVQ